VRKVLVFSTLFIILYLLLLLSGKFSHDETTGYGIIISFLLLSIGIILLGCELFANGVECVGERLHLSHATSGSILAAVGTALPETLLPVLALTFGAGGHGQSIAVGAILGAPFMLSTLAFFLVGSVSLALRLTGRRRRAVLQTNLASLKLELMFFIPVMLVLLCVSLVGNRVVNCVSAALYLLAYLVFVKISLNHAAEEGEEYTDTFHFSYIMSCPPSLAWITVQTIIGLGLIVVGAHIFIAYITLLSVKSGISSLLLSLIIAPVATELPEKFNSVTWTIKQKDTLAVSNISGAMVFQSTIPVSIGLLFTEWRLGAIETLNIVVSLTMALIVLCTIRFKKELPAWTLMIGGGFYLAYLLNLFVLRLV